MIIHSRKLYAVLVSWLSFYLKFPKAERYISGLEFAHGLAGKNVIDILIDYIKDFQGISLPAAAKIVNVQEGLSSILVIFTAHLSDAYLGLFKTIVIANFFYLIGLVLFCIAVYVDSIETKILFVALFFLALGISGRDFLLESFLSDQRQRPSDPTVVEDEVDRVSWRPYKMLLLITVVSVLVNVFPVPEGSLIIITIATVVAGYLCFLSGHSFYWKRPLTGGPLATTFRVFKAAILKRCLRYPNNYPANSMKTREPVMCYCLPSHSSDTAASPESSSSISEEKLQSNDRPCTVVEVKEVKRLLTMIPMWIPFLVYSLVGAAGNTFFFEQSSSMDNGLFLIIFVICKDWASLIASDMGKQLPKLKFLKTRQRLETLVRMGIGMLCSLSCCIVAWRVEKFRLKTDENMNVLWLLPQFVLLGCMEGFAEKGLREFFKTQVSGSMRDYGPAFNEFVLGLGKFINAIVIVIFKDWFREDVDSSHLDRYYEFLALLSLLNFFVFGCTAVWYGNQQVEMENLIPVSITYGNQQVEVENLIPVSITYGNQKVEMEKSHSFPPRLLKTSSFQSSVRSLRRFFTAISSEKEA